MSVLEAIQATMQGDTTEADRQIGRVLLKSAIQAQIFCSSCRDILDVKRAVLTTSKVNGKASLACATCFDATKANVLEAHGPEALKAGLAHLEIVDGREMSKRPKGHRLPSSRAKITGEAVNSATGETRTVALSERAIARLIGDEEHSTCAGPCECQIEPDGECENFWPSQLRAVGMV